MDRSLAARGPAPVPDRMEAPPTAISGRISSGLSSSNSKPLENQPAPEPTRDRSTRRGATDTARFASSTIRWTPMARSRISAEVSNCIDRLDANTRGCPIRITCSFCCIAAKNAAEQKGGGGAGSFSTTQLSELIGRIYDAAIDPSRWPVAIEDIRLALGFGSAAFNLQALPSGEVLVNVTSNIPQPYVERMAGYGAEVLELWGGIATVGSLPMDQPAVLSQINTGLDVTTNRYFVEWGKPQGMIDFAGPATRARRGRARLAILQPPCRQRSHQRVADRGCPIAAPPSPACRNDQPVARHRGACQVDLPDRARHADGADLHHHRRSRIVHANPAAQKIVASGDLLNTRNGVLGARVAAVASALAMAVSQAAQDESGIGRKGLGVPIRWQDGSAGAVHVLPLRPGRGTSKQASSQRCLSLGPTHPLSRRPSWSRRCSA